MGFNIMVETDRADVADDLLSALHEAAACVLQQQQADAHSEITILLTDDAYLQQLNCHFRQVDAATDVLSFAADAGFPGASVDSYLGDIAISVPFAARQAAVSGHSLHDELQLLLVHGILHLLGYDHETEAEKADMWAVQTAVLSQLNLTHITPE